MSYINFIRKVLLLFSNRRKRNMMIGDLKEIFRHNRSIENKPSIGEKEFVKKWKVLDNRVSPLSYRFYSNYLGENIDMVPSDTARMYIEPILNQEECANFYNDKNSFDLFIDPNDTPKTLFRSIGYKLYDGEYNAVIPENFDNCFSTVNQVIVKPAKELGGRGIEFFERENGILINRDGTQLTLEYLTKYYQTNYLIQANFVQSDYMCKFNPTSVNTIRVNAYRDINTGEMHILGAALRIGKAGYKVDNASSGGVIVGIDDNGKLAQCVYDKYGNSSTIHNGIDFSKEEFIIPNFKMVKEFAVKICKRLPHMRLFALDIVLNESNVPKLIEVNTMYFSVKFLQLTKQPVFGKFTDDVIEYCLRNKSYLSVVFPTIVRKHDK